MVITLIFFEGILRQKNTRLEGLPIVWTESRLVYGAFKTYLFCPVDCNFNHF